VGQLSTYPLLRYLCLYVFLYDFHACYVPFFIRYSTAWLFYYELYICANLDTAAHIPLDSSLLLLNCCRMAPSAGLNVLDS
jgi:hypothetical protein